VAGPIDYEDLDKPAVARRRTPSAGSSGPAYDTSEIPAFLRKQAD